MHYLSAFNGISVTFSQFRAELCSVQKLIVTQQTLVAVNNITLMELIVAQCSCQGAV